MKASMTVALGALFLMGCGGGVGGTGSYCVEVDPVVYDFGCESGTLQATVTNSCGVALEVTEPVVDPACSDRITVDLVEGTPALEDGQTVVFDITYTPVSTDLWDCSVTFPHDLATEPAPELPLAGGGTACETARPR